MLLRDMDRATAEILEAIERRERIYVYGDYDADGLTSTALLANFFRSLDIPVSTYIPDRLSEGYGLNESAVARMAEKGRGLIITVDCGTSNGHEINLAKRLGMGVVVTDHHQVPKGFQPFCPVVNPHRRDCPYPFKHLAGVGLAFLLAISVRAALRGQGLFRNRQQPDLREYLDLVALGTVADRVPLMDQNRIMVKGGIGMLIRSRWPGLVALKEAADITNSEITSFDLAFRLAPRLNAPGRMDRPDLALQLLTTAEPHLASQLASRTNILNHRRQIVERSILEQIEKRFEAEKRMEKRKTLVVSGEGWHPGVLGIVASRLVERYHRPSLVLNIQDGLAVGSGRSISGFNLYGALAELGNLFEKFGGHAHAAGFALKPKNLGILKRELELLAEHRLKKEDLIASIDVDAEIPLEALTFQTVTQIHSLSPFGEANPEPFFLSRSLEVKRSMVVGENHLKLIVRQGSKDLEAIGFGLSDWHSLEGATIDMVFTPGLDRWQGRDKIRLKVIDLALTGDIPGLVLEDSSSELNVLGTENKQGLITSG
jgi:single-stranded-DNA-specific exonuclease